MAQYLAGELSAHTKHETDINFRSVRGKIRRVSNLGTDRETPTGTDPGI